LLFIHDNIVSHISIMSTGRKGCHVI